MRRLVAGGIRPRRHYEKAFCKDAVTTAGYDFLLVLSFSSRAIRFSSSADVSISVARMLH